MTELVRVKVGRLRHKRKYFAAHKTEHPLESNLLSELSLNAQKTVLNTLLCWAQAWCGCYIGTCPVLARPYLILGKLALRLLNEKYRTKGYIPDALALVISNFLFPVDESYLLDTTLVNKVPTTVISLGWCKTDPLSRKICNEHKSYLMDRDDGCKVVNGVAHHEHLITYAINMSSWTLHLSSERQAKVRNPGASYQSSVVSHGTTVYYTWCSLKEPFDTPFCKVSKFLEMEYIERSIKYNALRVLTKPNGRGVFCSVRYL